MNHIKRLTIKVEGLKAFIAAAEQALTVGSGDDSSRVDAVSIVMGEAEASMIELNNMLSEAREAYGLN
ncbi:hypothetical protein [Paenochrobactrum pullorum]|uniref:hypothetical protein n=1 Tax=Paenochrobactrum pullorum TaxID=1324351 RepID=UPI0035BC83FE